MSKRTANPPPAAPGPQADRAALRRELLSLGYRDLFLRLDHGAADRLWTDSAAALEALVRDPDEDAQARFLAAELLFLRRPDFPPVDLRPLLAPVYAEALAQSATPVGPWRLVANQWGLLWAGDDTGTVGRHLLALGADAIAPLRPLLDDGRRVLYEGSREATSGNARAYRIKDVAAYYLGRLVGKPVRFHQDHAARDREIAALSESLP